MAKKTDDDYEAELEKLQLALVGWQQWAIEAGDKTLIIFEGRDAAGKDGTIQRITEPLSVRNTRIFAPTKPTEHELSQWFFQRFVAQLPASGQTVIFNRSWYNRGGVERVMGFTKPEAVETFLRDVPGFETMLVESGFRLVKFWLDVSKAEQAKRLKERAEEPIKALKRSPLDAAAQEKWDDYTGARDELLLRTHTKDAPWTCVRGDHKKAARLNVIRHLVRTLAPKSVAKSVDKPDASVLFSFEEAALKDGRLER